MSKVNQNNTIHISAAGSGKTTKIVNLATESLEQRVLVLTYTNKNLALLRSRVIAKLGVIPQNITIVTYLSFLLRDCIRPFQNRVLNTRVNAINFYSKKEIRAGVKKGKSPLYFLDSAKNIYNDHVSDLACLTNERTDGLVIDRLEHNYDHIFIDEVQDFNGFDLDILDYLFDSKTSITAVGDPRQAILDTNKHSKYRQYKGQKIMRWFAEREQQEKCKIEPRTLCYRCCQEICNVADALFPKYDDTTAHNKYENVSHKGVFTVCPSDLEAYYREFNPVILQYSKSANTRGFDGINIGVAKGQTYDRVLIVPTEDIKKFLKTGKSDHLKDLTLAKLYVAITRARHSVAFLLETKERSLFPKYPPVYDLFGSY